MRGRIASCLCTDQRGRRKRLRFVWSQTIAAGGSSRGAPLRPRDWLAIGSGPSGPGPRRASTRRQCPQPLPWPCRPGRRGPAPRARTPPRGPRTASGRPAHDDHVPPVGVEAAPGPRGGWDRRVAAVAGPRPEPGSLGSPALCWLRLALTDRRARDWARIGCKRTPKPGFASSA